MIETPLQRRTPLPPQLTRRVGVLGVVGFVLFGIVAFRLWYLQVLTGPQNAALATANVVQTIPTPAPRGNILDASGNMLATSRNATDVAIVYDDLPPAGARRKALYTRLSHVLHISRQSIAATVDDTAVAPPHYAPTHIAYVDTHQLAYLYERQRSFPGVIERSVPVRYYPFGDIGSVVLGEVGQISGPSQGSRGELGTAAYKGVKAGTVVGQSGLESAYQPYLQGVPGAEKIQIDAEGFPTGVQKTVLPRAGDQLVTSLHLGLEREGYAAVDHAIAYARSNHLLAPAGSFVAIDPFSGYVYAMGSVPTYDANEFATGVSTSQYRAIQHEQSDYDRAIDGLYPTGSTFKPITALAALDNGLITPSTLQGAGSTYTVGSGASAQSFTNSGDADYGDQDLAGALEVSEDTYFYPLGALLNGDGEDLALQDAARSLGLGRSPGIDVGDGGAAGIVPDYRWVQSTNAAYLRANCNGSAAKPAAAHDQLAITACAQGYYDPPWTVGQNIQLATGQGYLEASPLQMAIAYSAIVNGGKVWTPQIGKQILSASGSVVAQLPSPHYRPVHIAAGYQQAILDGLHLAAQGPSGTSSAVFSTFPRPVYGKTGTAQHQNKSDQSWYVAYAPDTKRPIVIAVTIEQGGFGAGAAAPAVRLMLSQWFGIAKKFVPGASTDQ